jgi:flagellar basal body-associated protein FliL
MRVPTALLLAALLCAPALAEEDTPAPKHKVTQSESYVAFEPIYATIVDAGRPSGMLMVHFGLDIPDEELREETVRSQPVLRDAYVRNLLSFTATAVRPWRQPDVEVISERLQKLTDRALKKKGARVLLAQVAMRISR